MQYEPLYQYTRRFPLGTPLEDIAAALEVVTWTLIQPSKPRWINENTVLSVLGDLNVAATLFSRLKARAEDPFDLSTLDPRLPAPEAWRYMLRKLQSEEGINLSDPLTRDSIFGLTQPMPSIADKQVLDAEPLLTMAQALAIISLAWVSHRDRDAYSAEPITVAHLEKAIAVGARIASIDVLNVQVKARGDEAKNELQTLRDVADAGTDFTSTLPTVDQLLAG